MNTKITQKINNTDYAPGIATYGNTGADGARGDAGNCIYYTTFNITTGEDLPSFKKAVRELRLPVNEGQKINRPFLNGDYFFDKFGNIFTLYNIEDLKNHPNLGNNYKRFFKQVGNIQSKNQEDIFTAIENTGRLSLNSKYAGIDINSSETIIKDDNDNNNYPLRIISNNQNGDNIELLNMTAFHDYDQMPDLKIYYDTVRHAWHIDSDVPIVIDSELAINRETNDTIDLDGYSPVIISDTPITVFYNLARTIKWAVNGANGIQLMYFNTKENPIPDNIKNNILVKILFRNSSGNYNTVFIPANGKQWDENMCCTGAFKSKNIKHVSLIYNIEIIIEKIVVPAKYTQTQYSITDPTIDTKFNLVNQVKLPDLVLAKATPYNSLVKKI